MNRREEDLKTKFWVQFLVTLFTFGCWYPVTETRQFLIDTFFSFYPLPSLVHATFTLIYFNRKLIYLWSQSQCWQKSKYDIYHQKNMQKLWLTLLWRRFLSYRNQSIGLQSKSAFYMIETSVMNKFNTLIETHMKNI